MKLPKGAVHCKRFEPKENKAYLPFKKTVHFQDRNRKWVVVHGQIIVQKGENASTKQHSWCEQNGMVLDVHYNILMTKKEYYSLNQVLETQVSRYSYAEVCKKLEQTRTYARWEE